MCKLKVCIQKAAALQKRFIGWRNMARLSLASPNICHLHLRVTYISNVPLATRKNVTCISASLTSHVCYLHSKNGTQTLARTLTTGAMGGVGWGGLGCGDTVSFPSTCKARMAHKHRAHFNNGRGGWDGVGGMGWVGWGGVGWGAMLTFPGTYKARMAHKH